VVAMQFPRQSMELLELAGLQVTALEQRPAAGAAADTVRFSIYFLKTVDGSADTGLRHSRLHSTSGASKS